MQSDNSGYERQQLVDKMKELTEKKSSLLWYQAERLKKMQEARSSSSSSSQSSNKIMRFDDLSEAELVYMAKVNEKEQHKSIVLHHDNFTEDEIQRIIEQFAHNLVTATAIIARKEERELFAAEDSDATSQTDVSGEERSSVGYPFKRETNFQMYLRCKQLIRNEDATPAQHEFVLRYSN